MGVEGSIPSRPILLAYGSYPLFLVTFLGPL